MIHTQNYSRMEFDAVVGDSCMVSRSQCRFVDYIKDCYVTGRRIPTVRPNRLPLAYHRLLDPVLRQLALNSCQYFPVAEMQPVALLVECLRPTKMMWPDYRVDEIAMIALQECGDDVVAVVVPVAVAVVVFVASLGAADVVTEMTVAVVAIVFAIEAVACGDVVVVAVAAAGVALGGPVDDEEGAAVVVVVVGAVAEVGTVL